MKNTIKEHKETLKHLQNKIILDIENTLKDFADDKKTDDYIIYKLNCSADVEKVLYGNGFYIILTNMNFEGNNCTFKIGQQKAIYRGHCFTVKSRIKSHLFKDVYKEELRLHFERTKKRKGEYTTCIKIEDGVEGVNINQEPYSKYQWTVVVYKMKGSTKFIREQAEFAFDRIFGKPIKSKEK